MIWVGSVPNRRTEQRMNEMTSTGSIYFPPQWSTSSADDSRWKSHLLHCFCTFFVLLFRCFVLFASSQRSQPQFKSQDGWCKCSPRLAHVESRRQCSNGDDEDDDDDDDGNDDAAAEFLFSCFLIPKRADNLLWNDWILLFTTCNLLIVERKCTIVGVCDDSEDGDDVMMRMTMMMRSIWWGWRGWGYHMSFQLRITKTNLLNKILM